MQTPQRLDTIFIWFTPNGPKCLTNCQPKSLQPKTEKTVKKIRKKSGEKQNRSPGDLPARKDPPKKKLKKKISYFVIFSQRDSIGNDIYIYV